MDFKSVRAMFEEKEYLPMQPKPRPVGSDKPKAVSAPQSPSYFPPQSPSYLPPQSPSHLSPQSPSYLPAGARPSLLTSMTQALEAKAVNAPRVVFKNEKEAKKPLIQPDVKGKEKSDGKGKESKSKTGKEGKKPEDKQEDSSDQKDKKLLSFLSKKEETAELVPAPAPPKAQKKKGFPVFRKTTKRDSAIILDSPSLEESGPAPLSSDAENIPEDSIYSVPKANLLQESPSAGLTPPTHNPAPPDFFTPPAVHPEVPVLKASAPQIQPPSDAENPALPDFSTIRQNDKILNPPSVVPSPPIVAAPPPPIVATPSRPSFAPPSPPRRRAPAGSTSSNSAPTSHPNVAPQTPPTVAAPVPPNSVAPNLSGPAVLDLLPSASLTPPQKASPTTLLSESPARSPSGSPAPPTRLTVSEASPPELQVSGGIHAEDRRLTPDLQTPLKIERSISALTALERAGDMSTGKRTPPSDLRILNALEKARRKTAR